VQPADLIFIRGTEGIAGPIKWLTQSPYTHIAGLVDEGQIFESQAGRRAGFESVETYKGVADVYRCPLVTEEQRREIINAVLQWAGSGYDYLRFGSLACRQILGAVIPMPVYSSRTRHICTTLWVDAYRAAGIDLCPGVAHPTPGELAQSPLLEFAGSF
jgi:hypothetical protein